MNGARAAGPMSHRNDPMPDADRERTRGEVRYLVKLKSASDTYFYAYAVPQQGETKRRYRFSGTSSSISSYWLQLLVAQYCHRYSFLLSPAACQETDNVEHYRVLPVNSSSVWRGAWAKRDWRRVTPCGWCPKANFHAYRPLSGTEHADLCLWLHLR